MPISFIILMLEIHVKSFFASWLSTEKRGMSYGSWEKAENYLLNGGNFASFTLNALVVKKRLASKSRFLLQICVIYHRREIKRH